MSALPDILAEAERFQSDREAGQANLFGGGPESGADRPPELTVRDVRPWTGRQRLRAERETLGLYLSGHPLDELREELAGFITTTLDRIESRVSSRPSGNNGRGRGRSRGVEMVLAGLVVAVRKRPGKGAFIALDDGTGRLEVAVFEPLYHQAIQRLVADEILVVRGKVEVDDYRGGFRMVADEILEVDEARGRFAQHLEIDLGSVDEAFDKDLAAALHPYRSGHTPIVVRYENDCARALLKLGEDWQISPSTDLLAAIDGLQGIRRVRLRY